MTIKQNVHNDMEARPVPDADGKYSVNRAGEVFGPRGKLKPTLLRVGYLSVAFSLGNRKVKRVYVHRLVAEVFIGSIPSKSVVDHINHDKTDNRLENLRIVDRSANGKAWVKTGSRVAPLGDRGRSSHCKRGHPYSFTSSGGAYCPTCRKLRSSGKITRPAGEWVDISIEGYSISSDGEVWSNKTMALLRPGVNGAGYQYVHVGGAVHAIHRLVAIAFIGAIPENHVVDHVNGNKHDNSSSNLRIISRSKNSMSYHDRRIENLDIQTVQAEIKWLALYTKIPQTAIGSHYGVSQTNVAEIKYGKIHGRVDPIRPKIIDLDHYVKLKTRTCVVCGKDFDLTRSDKKYCSLSCKSKASQHN